MKRTLWSLLLAMMIPSAAFALTQASVPAKIPTPWGNSASVPYIRSIPVPSQIGIQNCAASFTDGFPPLTFAIPSAGGCPPFGADFNGILQQITQWNRWQAAGGPILYDSAFQSSIGGYPKGAYVGSLTTPGLIWISTADNNTSNPDTGGTNWGNAAVVGVGNLGGALSGTLPNPSLASGAASANIGALGGSLGGTLPNPSLAAGAASANIGGLGGALAGTLPNPTIATNASLPGSPTTSTQAIADATNKIATTLFVNPSFLKSLPGYVELPSGLILEWGTLNTSGGASVTVTFPKAFPNSPLVGFAAESTAGAWGNHPAVSAVNNATWTTTQMQVFTQQWNGTAFVNATSDGVYWFVIGY